MFNYADDTNQILSCSYQKTFKKIPCSKLKYLKLYHVLDISIDYYMAFVISNRLSAQGCDITNEGR